MSTRLTWQPISTVQNIDHYNVYRSIIGVIAPNAGPYALTDGMTLEVKVDNGSTQTYAVSTGDFVSVGAATAEEVVVALNRDIDGVMAHASYESPKRVYIRSAANGAGASIEIVGGTANAVFGFITTKQYEKSTFLNLAEVPFLTNPLQYIDNNGKCYDWYHVTAVDAIANESAPSLDKQAGPPHDPTCIVYGKVQTAAGVPVPDCEVRGTIEFPPSINGVTYTAITKTPIITLTLEDGTFELELLQGSVCIVEIPQIDFTRRVEIPAQSSANLFGLKIIENSLTSAYD